MQQSAHSVTANGPLDPGRLAGVELLERLKNGGIAPPPFCETTDIWPVSIAFGEVHFEGTPSRNFYNPMGTVHGGWISALLDTAMASAVHSTLDPGQTYATIEMKTVMVKPVVAATGPLLCKGVVLHQGRRVAHAEGKIFDRAGTLVAYGSETCLITGAAREARMQPAEPIEVAHP